MKCYVDVLVRWRDDGRIDPLAVIWPDGRKFDIDEVIGKPMRRASRQTGGTGLRYDVRIGSAHTALFLEDDIKGLSTRSRWFVEKIIPDAEDYEL